MGRYRFDPVSGSDYREWYRDWAPALEHRSPFHHPSWIDAIAKTTRARPFFLAASEGGDVVGVLPGFMLRVGPFKAFGSPLRGQLTSYMGPISPELSSEIELLALTVEATDYLRRRFGVIYARTTLRNAPSVLPTDSAGRGLVHQTPGSYRLEISDGIETVWTGLTSDCRRNIRRARQEQASVVPLDDPNLFFDMLAATFRRHGSTSTHDAEFFRTIHSELSDTGLLQPLCAVHDGRVVSAAIFLADDREIHHLSSASDPGTSSFSTSHLLHWRAIEMAIDAGLRTYNSDKSGIRSIDRFKESFRAKLERRFTLIGTPRSAYWAQRRLFSGYRRYRRIRARVSSYVR